MITNILSIKVWAQSFTLSWQIQSNSLAAQRGSAQSCLTWKDTFSNAYSDEVSTQIYNAVWCEQKFQHKGKRSTTWCTGHLWKSVLYGMVTATSSKVFSKSEHLRKTKQHKSLFFAPQELSTQQKHGGHRRERLELVEEKSRVASKTSWRPHQRGSRIRFDPYDIWASAKMTSDATLIQMKEVFHQLIGEECLETGGIWFWSPGETEPQWYNLLSPLCSPSSNNNNKLCTSFSLNNVIQMHNLQDTLKILVLVSLLMHVIQRIRVDDLIAQCSNGHVGPGRQEEIGHGSKKKW